MREAVMRLVGYLAFAVGVAAGLAMIDACAGSGPSQAEVAMRTYEGEQAACVAVYDTRTEIDTCRATVRRLWGQGPPMAPPLTTIGPDGGLLRDGGF